LVSFIILFLIGQNISVFAQTGKYSVMPQVNDTNLQVQVYASGFKFPTGMNFLGPDDILVLEKNTGKVKEIKNGTVSGTLLDVNVANISERGMLGIAISDKPKYVFLFYTETEGFDGGKVLGNRLYRYEYDNGKLINPKLLLDLPTIPGPSHNGGVLKIGPDNKTVYLVIGNLNYVQNQSFITKAQNNKNGPPPDGRGGVLRITFDGGVVDNKGILGDEDPLNKYYAYGIRNSFGMDFDPITGKLWDTENGPKFGDEINLVEPGFNSGWNKVVGIWKALPKDYQARGDLASEKPDNLVDFDGRGKYSSPEFTWNNSVAPTALKFLSTNKLGKQYENDMLVADVNNYRIYHFELNQNRTALLLQAPLIDKVADSDEELNNVIFARGFGLITDLEIGPDGYLYFVAFDEGKIYRIVPK
jgi:aldose sugar dehydrogenase